MSGFADVKKWLGKRVLAEGFEKGPQGCWQHASGSFKAIVHAYPSRFSDENIVELSVWFPKSEVVPLRMLQWRLVNWPTGAPNREMCRTVLSSDKDISLEDRLTLLEAAWDHWIGPFCRAAGNWDSFLAWCDQQVGLNQPHVIDARAPAALPILVSEGR